MLMYQFRNLSVHAALICRVQFMLAFQSSRSGLESMLCDYGLWPQQSWKEISRAAILTGIWHHSLFWKEKGIQ